MIKNNYMAMWMIAVPLHDAISGIKAIDSGGFAKLRFSVAYNLQQVCEKLIKIQIYSLCVNVNFGKMYTHSLVRLIQYAEQNNIPIYVPNKIRKNAVWITT